MTSVIGRQRANRASLDHLYGRNDTWPLDRARVKRVKSERRDFRADVTRKPRTNSSDAQIGFQTWQSSLSQFDARQNERLATLLVHYLRGHRVSDPGAQRRASLRKLSSSVHRFPASGESPIERRWQRKRRKTRQIEKSDDAGDLSIHHIQNQQAIQLIGRVADLAAVCDKGRS